MKSANLKLAAHRFQLRYFNGGLLGPYLPPQEVSSRALPWFEFEFTAAGNPASIRRLIAGIRGANFHGAIDSFFRVLRPRLAIREFSFISEVQP